jgi:hypothetical protein
MTAERYDICQAKKKKDGGVWWHKIGTIWPMKDDRFSVTFDSLPIPEYDDQYGLQVRAVAFPADQDRKTQSAPAVDPAMQGKADLDDEIPF